MKKTDKWIGLLAMAFFLSFGALQFFMPDRDMSQLENRYLQKTPEFSRKHVLSGRWGNETETWLIDQFPFRESWVGMDSAFSRYVLQNHERNGVYVTRQRLFSRTDDPGGSLTRNLSALTRLSEQVSVPFHVVVVPTATTVMQEELPAYAPFYDERSTSEKLTEALGSEMVIDLYEPLTEAARDKELYFRTDHHWNMEGAYVAYAELLRRSGMKPYGRGFFQTVTVTDDFHGTSYAKAGLWSIKPESIELVQPDGGYQAVMTVGNDTELPLFDEARLLEYDKYAYFLSGNQSAHIIDSGLETGRRLVIIKDSYAHILVPFLTLHYDQVVLLDPRYINVNPYELIAGFDPTEVWVLMNGDNLGQENGLSLFLRY